jgi:aspartokinase
VSTGKITGKPGGKGAKSAGFAGLSVVFPGPIPQTPGRNRLAFRGISEHAHLMRMPSQPVQMSVEQIQDLNLKLSTLRHDINNHLSLIMAAAELIRHKPQMAERMMETLVEQPQRITTAMNKFSADFETTFGIVRT